MGDTPFKLDIDPEAVNKLIAEAVLKSSIGPEIDKAVQDHLKSFGKSWNFTSHIENVVKAEISTHIRELIREATPQIREFVTAHMTDEVMESILTKMWDKWERSY